MGDLPLENISLRVARKRTEEIQGRRTALAIFPEEVWRLILKEVNSPNDLWNVSHATMQLDEILSKDKGTLFFTKIFPLLFPYLDTKSIYNCHFVCKLWNNTIDKTLLSQMPIQTSNPNILEETKPSLQLSSIEQINLAEETFLTTWNVPSFIEINLDSDQLDNFLSSAKELLFQFSSKVYYLKLVGCQRYAPAGLYNCLMEILAILPNIKVSEMECKYNQYSMELQINALRRTILVSMLPPLKNLDKLCLDFKNTPPEFLHELLKVYGKQLKSLKLKFSARDVNESEFWKDLEFPLLKKLAVDVHRFIVISDVLKCLEEGNKLKKLSLVVPYSHDYDEDSILDIIKTLKGFKESLKFFQVFGENLNSLRSFTRMLGNVMGTWIECDKKDGYERWVYFVHAGPGLCE